MKSITCNYARSNLAETMDRVCQDHSRVIITRRNGQTVVMLSREDYHALEETAHLLGSPRNALRLVESVAELEGSGRRWKGKLASPW